MTNVYPKRIKLLAISHNLNLEGASISMHELIVGLKEAGYIDPAVLSFDDGDLRGRYEALGVEVLDLPFSPLCLRTIDELIPAIKKLADLMKNINPDVVYANTILGYPAIYAASQLGIPTLWNIRESQDMNYWREFFGDRLDFVLDTFNKASLCVFVARETAKLWHGRFPGLNSRCIPNALNLPAFRSKSSNGSRKQWRIDQGIDEDAVVFLCVGTIHQRKGQLDLIQAVSLVDTKFGPELCILLVGDTGGEYSKLLHRKIDALDEELRSKIRILPKQYEIADVYAAADVFVCCSRNESYPRIILEAMASSLAIITTPVFGISEQVRFGGNALKYEPEDFRELATHMQYLYSDQKQRNIMAVESRRRLEQLDDFSAMLDAYGQAIVGLASNPV